MTQTRFLTRQRIPVLIAAALAIAAILMWVLRVGDIPSITVAAVAAASFLLHAVWLYKAFIREVTRTNRVAMQSFGSRIPDVRAMFLIREIAALELILVAVLAGVIALSATKDEWNGVLRWNAAGVGLVVTAAIVIMTIGRYVKLRPSAQLDQGRRHR